MAKTIPQLTDATTVNAADELIIQQGGVTKRATGAELAKGLNAINGTVNVKEFGAVGDGVADDTAAIQAALNSNQTVFMPRGRYRITSELVVNPATNRGAGLVGGAAWSAYPTTQQSGGPVWDGQQECVIVYDGITSATAAMLRASVEPVGTQVAQTFNNTIFGFRLEGILFDGNNKAGIGVYGIRLSEAEVQRVAVRGTTQHAFYFDQIYSGRFCKIHAQFNNGCGISVGRGTLDYSWTAGRFVNAVEFQDLYAAANGADKAYDETTNPLWGYGIGLWLHRGNVVTSYTSELNDGPALVLAPSSSTNAILGGYSEQSNSYSWGGGTAITEGRATQKWALWFVGDASAGSLNTSIGNVFMAAEAIRLTGTQPSSERTEGGVHLENITGANYLSADWGNYRLVNCAEELVLGVVGTPPAGAITISGGLQFSPTGVALSSYEEGNMTVSLLGISTAGTGWAYTVNSGSYTRVGNRCFFTGRITLSAKSTDATGQIAIAGLPFTIKNANQFHGSVTISCDNLTTNSVSTDGRLNINTTTVLLSKRTAASASVASMTLADLSDTTSIFFSGHYVVA